MELVICVFAVSVICLGCHIGDFPVSLSLSLFCELVTLTWTLLIPCLVVKCLADSWLGVKWGKMVGGQLSIVWHKLLFNVCFQYGTLTLNLPVLCFPENKPPVYGEETDPWLLGVQKSFCFFNKLLARLPLFKPPLTPTSKSSMCCQFLSLLGSLQCKLSCFLAFLSGLSQLLRQDLPAHLIFGFQNVLIVVSSPGLFVLVGWLQKLK